MLSLIALILAFLCFALAAFSFTAPFYNRLVAVGLAALTLSLLLGRAVAIDHVVR